MWNPLRPNDPPFALHAPTVRHTASLLLTTLFKGVVGMWILYLATKSPFVFSGALHLTIAYALLYARIPHG